MQYVCAYFNGPDCESFKLDNRPSFANNPNYLASNETNYQTAYDNVLKMSGAFPRDSVTLTSINEVMTRTGTWGARIPSNLLNGLQSVTPPLDTDNDGMADDWETKNGLDPTNAIDQHKLINTGYPAIEQYINELADSLL